MNLTEDEIAQAVAMAMILDLYDTCGDLTWHYVHNPDTMGAYELQTLTKNLTEEQRELVIESTNRFLRDAYGFVAERAPSQPTLF